MFTIHSHDTGSRQPWEYFPAAAGTYKCGQILAVTNGAVAPLDAALKTKPSYICVADVTIEEGQNIPVIRVADNVIYETTLTAEAADAKIGSKLEVSAGGLGVDATAEGAFEIVHIEDNKAGSVVTGRFN